MNNTKTWQKIAGTDKDEMLDRIIHENIRLAKKVADMQRVIKEYKSHAEHHKKRAETDQLTGVGSRHSLDTWEEIHYEPKKNTYIAICFDLVKFKYVNDTFGHDIGDKVLTIFAIKLLETFRFNMREDCAGKFFAPDNLFVRQGGDEFAVILTLDPKISKVDFLKIIDERINSNLIVNFEDMGMGEEIRHHFMDVRCRYSYAFSEPRIDLETLLQKADSKNKS